MYRSVLFTVVAALVVAGCASVPPEAALHAERLEEYHGKTTQGTIAAFDTVVESHDFAVEKLGAQVESLWRSYVEDTGSAANELDNIHAQLQLAISHLDQTDSGAAADAAAVRESLAKASTICSDAAARFRSYASDGTAEMSKDVTALATMRHSTQTASAELRQLIVEHHGFVADGIRLHRELFDSYNMVAVNRKGFFGGKLEARAQDLREKVDDVVDRVRGGTDSFSHILQGFLNDN